MDEFELEIEEAVPAAEVISAEVVVDDVLALQRSLPEDFNLPLLLQFLPDPKLKQKADALAAATLAIDVSAEGGLVSADKKMGELRDAIKEIEQCFADPTDLANKLHKRLTGLRADFCSNGKAALEVMERRLIAEQRRLDALAEQARRKAQEDADKLAREAAKKTAETAAKMGLPKEVVTELKAQAKVATAPPVSTPPTAAPPPLQSSTVTPKWVARFAGVNEDSGVAEDIELNPETADMTAEQRLRFFDLLRGVLDGKAALSFVKVDWAYANKRAGSDKAAFSAPGLVAIDIGGIRAKRKK